MAIALQHNQLRRTVGPSALVRETFARIVCAWQRRRAERELEGMPFDLRKDIGFRSREKSTR